MAVEAKKFPEFFEINGKIAYVVERPKLNDWVGGESNGFPAGEIRISKQDIKEIPTEQLPRT